MTTEIPKSTGRTTAASVAQWATWNHRVLVAGCSSHSRSRTSTAKAPSRAGLAHGALPWIGIVTGVAYLLVAIGIYAGIGILALWLGQVFYIAWAIWMGVTLRSSKAAPTVGLAPS
ncbi:MAG TPA: hypothetical protein VGU71_17305 [Candidatus Dormibacteraeota bacterium]|nr:hypothetical protein [Candidatus Dormibacteraeota bacterium]